MGGHKARPAVLCFRDLVSHISPPPSTDKGRQIVEESAEEFGKLDAKLLEGIAGEDLETFLRVLQQMQENITPSLSEGNHSDT